MKCKKQCAYLFAATILLTNVAATPMTIIAETIQETSSTEVAEARESQEEASNNTSAEVKQEQPQEMPVTNGEKVEEGETKEENSTTTEEIPVVENEEKAPEGATNAEVETDAGTITNQEVRLESWITEDKGSYVLIKQYTGNSINIVVPNEIDGKPTKLKDIDTTVFPRLSSTDTSSGVKSFKVLPKEDGTKVGLESTDLSDAFRDLSLLKEINLTGLETSNVTNFDYMFRGCSGLTSLDVSNWNVSNATELKGLFRDCSGLTSLDVSNWNVSNATELNSLFQDCSGLTSLDVSNWDVSSATVLYGLFINCSGLTSLDVSNWDVSSATDLNDLFRGCSGLTSLGVSNWDVSSATSLDRLFQNCSGLTSLDVSNWDVSSATALNGLFRNCSELTSLDVSNWDVSKATSFNSLFQNCSGLTSLDVSNWDVSKATSFNRLFQDCSGLTSLDVSKWHVSKLGGTALNFAFKECSNLKFLDLSNFNLSSVPSYGMSQMFKNIPNLLVITNDEKLLNYNYVADGVSPLSTPVLNANGGQFEDQTATKQYFTKVAYTSEEKINEVSTFEQFKNENVPTKSESKFLGWNLLEGNDSGAQNVYPDLYGTKYQAQWADASVNVKYVFEDTGKEIHEAKEILGSIGEAYDVTTEEYKLNIDGYVLDESRLPDNAKGTFLKDPQEVVYYYKAAPLSLVNGSFEDPVISKPNLSPLGYYWQGYTSIPGWKTTGSHIELQKAGPNFKIPAVDGNQWAEINYDQNAALYQDIKTTPGDTLYWEVYHRGTDGTDTAAVEIGKPDGQLVEQKQMTTPKTAWKKYSGFYTVPEGQTTTRFSIRTISVGSAYPSYGNSLDHVVFTNITSKITVNFVNENGTPIKEPQILKGYKDQAYDLTDEIEIAIPGYQLDESKIPEDIKGTFTEESKEITLTYKTLDINIPSQDVDNTKPGEISSYGIAYMPKQFQTNSTVLNDAGPQSIPINKKNRFDVGVRDLRNTASQWTLKAQLVWEEGKELQGSSIKTTNNSGTVMKNTNNGVDPFNPDTDLTTSNNEVQGTANVEITSTQSTPLMVANKVAHNAIYNYNLGDVSLEIPETRMIQPGTYNGYVEWNLSNTL